MAVPANPTVTSLVTQALKRAGRTTPTSTQIAEATDHAFQEVKADIMLKAATHPLLLTTATTVTTYGQQRYGTPDDFNIAYSLSLLVGPSEWAGTAQGATGTSLTLAASFSVDASAVIGRYILITLGDGREEYHEILGWDNTTKIASIEGSWVETPTATSQYQIINDYLQLYPSDAQLDLDRIRGNTILGRPWQATTFSQEILLYPVPDLGTYGLLNRYWVDLSKLNETGLLFTQLLREWRSVWIQGVTVKTMQRFDEDRYEHELNIYGAMLDILASATSVLRPIRFYDI